MTNFDYKAFAQSMKEQAQELVPQEFSEEDKTYLLSTLYNFALMSGEALVKQYDLEDEQAISLTQIVSEWTFHKSCDLIRSQVPKNCWDNILQKIAFTVFEIGREAFERNISQEDMLTAIENRVNKCYKDTLDELQSKNAMSEEVMSEALTYSNIDDMAEEANKSCADFDYKAFAQSMKEQAQEIVPKEFSKENKQYLVDTLYNFTLMSGEALAKESELKEDDAIMLVQIIAEWTFHKTCDLIRSQVPKQHWDNILQNIAFEIFSLGKKAMKENVDQAELLEDVEKKVNECYKTKLEELCNSNAITKEILEEALTHSSIDEVAEENKQKVSPSTQPKWETNHLKVYIAHIDFVHNETIQIKYKKMINTAFKAWLSAIDNKITYEITNDIMTSNINIAWEMIDSKPLGSCRFDYTDTNMLFSAEITIGLQVDKKGKITSTDNQVFHTMLHCIGIAFGVPQNQNTMDIMCIPHQYKVLDLSKNDINAIREIYGLTHSNKNSKFTKLVSKGAIALVALGIIAKILRIVWRLQGANIMKIMPILKANILPIFIGIIALVAIAGVAYYLITVYKIKKYENELEEVSNEMRDLTNTDKMYGRLGADVLCLSVGDGLMCIIDPDQSSSFLAKNIAIRQRLTDALGYIIPNIRIVDCTKLEENEYTISIRGTRVASGYVYPNKVMVKAKDWDETGKEIPENVTIGVAFDNEQCYWVNEVDAKGLNYLLPEDAIIKHEENIYIQYVDKIMVNADVEKYLEIVKAANPKLVETLLSRLDIEDIRDVFVNLIRERVSITDAPYIVERLSYHAREDKKPEYLSEQLRLDLALQICNQNYDNDNVIYATKLSKEWIKILSEVGFEEDVRGLKFAFDEAQKEDFIQEIGTQILKAQQVTNKKVALLCPKHFRLVIYRMLSEPLPNIIVLAEEEIQSGFKVEEV